MNEFKPNPSLSSSAKARKEAMLIDLQDELAVFHRRRKRKRIVAGSLVAGLTVFVIGLTLLDFNLEENNVRPRDVAEAKFRQDQPSIEAPPAFVVTVGNNDKAGEKYVVKNHKTTLALETVGDEELLAMLAATGNPSFIGKIDGETRLIPDSPPATN